jgi:hypothetical protein
MHMRVDWGQAERDIILASLIWLMRIRRRSGSVHGRRPELFEHLVGATAEQNRVALPQMHGRVVIELWIGNDPFQVAVCGREVAVCGM